ncbi:MAG: Gfo/Idh/MocA family oxidoreductase [Acidobacteriales bacterium]|nr:Gfo/Idh/MocA family oxidoreductase [Terriglobales bacterium]
MDRRQFLAASAAAPMVMSSSKAFGANDTIRVAVLGVNGRGTAHYNGFEPLENVEVTTFVDPDLDVANRRAKEFEAKYGHPVKVVQDMRRVFDDKDIDVVGIATPNHWHALAAVWACQAGKDVYVEKPGTHSLAQGRSMIAAAKKYKRIVQHGVQLRSSEAMQEAVQKLREGVIGDVYMGRATIFKWRPKLQNFPNEEPPKTLDYNLWVGPGKWRPYSKNHVHYNWHWTWDFGNGEIGNQGVHQLDMLQWGLGVKFPTKIAAMGGKYLWRDRRETPEVLTALCDFEREKKYAEIAVRFWCTNVEADGGSNGDLFYGSEGFMAVNGYTKYSVFLGPKRTPGPTGSAPARHFENFIKAVRSRKVEDQNGPVETAHYSSGLAHIANTAFRRGAVLQFDPDAECFVGDEQANALLADTYRDGFVMPAPGKV